MNFDVKELRIVIADSSAAGPTLGPVLARPIEVLEMIAQVTKTEATALVLGLSKYVLAGSSSGAVSGLAAITLPASNQQGKGYFASTLPNDAAPVLFDAMDQIVIAHTTPSTADKGITVVIRYKERTDLVKNCTDMVVSA